MTFLVEGDIEPERRGEGLGRGRAPPTLSQRPGPRFTQGAHTGEAVALGGGLLLHRR